MGTTQKIENEIVQATKPKRRRYRVGDHDFVAPDGGWGWLVVAACGFSNVRKNFLIFTLKIFVSIKKF